MLKLYGKIQWRPVRRTIYGYNTLKVRKCVYKSIRPHNECDLSHQPAEFCRIRVILHAPQTHIFCMKHRTTPQTYLARDESPQIVCLSLRCTSTHRETYNTDRGHLYSIYNILPKLEMGFGCNVRMNE